MHYINVEGATDHQKEAERVIEHGRGTVACGFEGIHHLESARSKNDGERDPESTVRGQSRGAKSVPDRHFPV